MDSSEGSGMRQSKSFMTGFRVAIGLLAVSGVSVWSLAGCGGKPEAEAPRTTAAAAPPAKVSNCEPSGTLAYLCNVTSGEDIVQVGSTKWLIASSIAPLGSKVGAGKMYLIDSQSKTAAELFPGSEPALRLDAAMYPGCPSLDLQSFDTHGLALREKSPKVYRLYATSHGAREAIQAWELDATGEKPKVTWVGCVPLPEKMFANSVAILPDGGFVTTKFMDPTDPQAFPKIQAGEINGAVYEWHPGGAVSAIAGTELSGPNGIELSADGRYLFVAAFGGHAIVRFDRGPNPGPRKAVAVDVTPDNLRWTQAGTLLTVGGNLTPMTGWAVYKIDTSAMTASKVGGADQNAALQGASTALQVGNEIWVGTYSGDRVGYFPVE